MLFARCPRQKRPDRYFCKDYSVLEKITPDDMGLGFRPKACVRQEPAVKKENMPWQKQ